ncbi:MAG: diguanylate cyclase [Nitrospiraceae bacterium]|nr:MAG: diguanylate cyclase [Nitrospiraceae bacterium]
MSKETISILVADNGSPAIDVIKSNLGNYSDINYTIDTAKSGQDAISKAVDAKFDLLLVGQDLPGAKGLKMVQEIIKRKLGVPVIMIVAEGQEKLGVKAMDKGAYDYLTKNEIKTVALNRAIHRVMQRKKLESDIRESFRKLEKLAIKDGLTGLFNHRHFREVLKNEYKKAKRHSQPLSCIMLDLDYFKAVNDNYGHQYGDFVLAQSAQILKRLVRDTDFVARYGGEEFFIILPNTDLQGAFILAERIRKIFVNNKFAKDKVSETVTISAGISATSDENVVSDDDLIANADKALYRAKWRGRNNVCYFEEIESEDTGGLKEELKKMEDFHVRFETVNDNIKDACIESAHNILCEIEKGWDYISEHSVRVSRYAEKLSRKLSLADEDVNVIKRAALLHDIGLVGIKSNIIKKKDKLTDKEYTSIKRHSNIGVRIVERTKLFQKELPIILHHHERFDGSGYPHMLKGETIPYGARILAVAEAYDVMRSSTVYKKASSEAESLAELKECAGTQFDPRIVSAFVKVIEKMQ